jgi:hypothetical protein
MMTFSPNQSTASCLRPRSKIARIEMPCIEWNGTGINNWRIAVVFIYRRRHTLIHR